MSVILIIVVPSYDTMDSVRVDFNSKLRSTQTLEVKICDREIFTPEGKQSHIFLTITLTPVGTAPQLFQAQNVWFQQIGQVTYPSLLKPLKFYLCCSYIAPTLKIGLYVGG